MSDQERLRAIAEREQRATKGPWAWESVAEQSNEYAVGTAWDTATDQPISGLIVRTDDPETDNWLEDRVLVRDSMGLGEGNMADAAFIAHAREDVPYLLSLVARQAQEIQDLRTERDKDLASLGLMSQRVEGWRQWARLVYTYKPNAETADLTDFDMQTLVCSAHDDQVSALSRRLDGEIADCDKSRRELASVSSSRDALREALKELRAVVLGECPSLLNEDSGGDARLALQIDKLLAETPTEDQ